MRPALRASRSRRRAQHGSDYRPLLQPQPVDLRCLLEQSRSYERLCAVPLADDRSNGARPRANRDCSQRTSDTERARRATAASPGLRGRAHRPDDRCCRATWTSCRPQSAACRCAARCARRDVRLALPTGLARFRGAETSDQCHHRGCRSPHPMPSLPSPSTRCASQGAPTPRATPRPHPRQAWSLSKARNRAVQTSWR